MDRLMCNEKNHDCPQAENGAKCIICPENNKIVYKIGTNINKK
jgi:hypothetical protein